MIVFIAIGDDDGNESVGLEAGHRLGGNEVVPVLTRSAVAFPECAYSSGKDHHTCRARANVRMCENGVLQGGVMVLQVPLPR